MCSSIILSLQNLPDWELPEEQNNLQYSTVHFNEQADPVYANMRGAQSLRHMEEREVSEYSAVTFNSGSTRNVTHFSWLHQVFFNFPCSVYNCFRWWNSNGLISYCIFSIIRFYFISLPESKLKKLKRIQIHFTAQTGKPEFLLWYFWWQACDSHCNWLIELFVIMVHLDSTSKCILVGKFGK